MNDIYLGVNIDHVATLRQARGTNYPSIIDAAAVAEKSGADSITIHLREDRRHIQLEDVRQLKDKITTKMNLEMAVTENMVDIACEIKPEDCCLVPEKRQELTTEGGLDIISQEDKLTRAIDKLHQHNIRVSPFIDADFKQIDAVVRVGAKIIEIHTGHYADASNPQEAAKELAKIIKATEYAHSLGLQVNAGHGLHYFNVDKIAQIPQIVELNIGHSIISQAVFLGLDNAVRQMKQLMVNSRIAS